jgi:hypothetical protein
MIDAYIVRDPQGRVIGMSVSGEMHALRDAFPGDLIVRGFWALLTGYTLKREQVAL